MRVTLVNLLNSISVTVNKGWFRPKVQIERVDLERYFIIVEDPSHFVWQNLSDINVIEDRYQIFDRNGVERNIFGDVVSRVRLSNCDKMSKMTF